jgi:hypothetical protein
MREEFAVASSEVKARRGEVTDREKDQIDEAKGRDCRYEWKRKLIHLLIL